MAATFLGELLQTFFLGIFGEPNAHEHGVGEARTKFLMPRTPK